jgi:excisionase family DNA binding protein
MNEKAQYLQTLSLKEVAEILRISVRGVYRLFESKKLPCIKVGGLNRVRLSDLEAYMNRQANISGVTA